MAWCQPDDKPLSESMMVSLLMHIYASLGPSELIENYSIVIIHMKNDNG